MNRVLWVPGTFRGTNGLLDDLRAAGRFEGFAKAKGWPIRGGHDAFAEHQAAVRLAVKAAAMRAFAQGCAAWTVDLAFWLFGHGRHDPDAWYLLGKAAVDGLADAGIIDSDRFNVRNTRGRVLHGPADEIAKLQVLAQIPGGRPLVGFSSGLAIQIERVDHA
jgi:hypothetical protein